MGEQGKDGEFELIARYFAPLAAAEEGAFALGDDAAVLAMEPGRRLVVTTDTLIESVHFTADTPPEAIAAKLLRVNLSDLAAMGARPRAYTLSAALGEEIDGPWLEGFAAALAREQETFSITLVGGDTTATPGPLALTLCALGDVPEGRELRRSGARPGDAVFVSGSIGDAALGLKALLGELAGLGAGERDMLIGRYHLPQPRLELGQCLRGLANAAADVSDGLVADLGHICATSRTGAAIEAARVPLSAAARAAIAADESLIGAALTGGDDYELVFAVPGGAAGEVALLGTRLDLPLTEIGRITDEEGEGVRVLDRKGNVIPLGAGGYRHF